MKYEPQIFYHLLSAFEAYNILDAIEYIFLWKEYQSLILASCSQPDRKEGLIFGHLKSWYQHSEIKILNKIGWECGKTRTEYDLWAAREIRGAWKRWLRKWLWNWLRRVGSFQQILLSLTYIHWMKRFHETLSLIQLSRSCCLYTCTAHTLTKQLMGNVSRTFKLTQLNNLIFKYLRCWGGAIWSKFTIWL